MMALQLKKKYNMENNNFARINKEANKAAKLSAIASGLSAANDPNLRRGQSRIASGVSAFTDAALAAKDQRLARADAAVAEKLMLEEAAVSERFARKRSCD